MARLAELRRNAGLTQAELARLCDVDEATVRRWENGGRVPHEHTRIYLAGVLRVRVEELEFGERH